MYENFYNQINTRQFGALQKSNRKKMPLRRLLMTGAALAFIATPAYAADLPTGGQITAGSGSISQSGDTMTINQDTANMAADWQSFSIGNGHTVNFVQPSSSSVALNRVLGSDVSVIQGALNANGKVFIVNPNGVTFTPDAQVNVGGLVASTLEISTEDFMSGHYTFEGDSNASIKNQGNIKAHNGGAIALVAAHIINEGNITADEGAVLMGAGRKVTLDFGGPVKLEVEEGALDTLIEQGGAVRANGGRVYLTAKAASDISTSVINHSGITEAKTLSTGKNGEIILTADKDVGHANINGTLDASAPEGGDGGFIETSAAHIGFGDNLTITATTEHGNSGEWLIDPYNYIIDASAATNIVNTLNNGTDVTVSTAADVANQGSSGDSSQIGDITVASAINKTGVTNSALTLQAANNIVVNAGISSTNSALNVNLDADNNNGTRDGGGIVILNNNINTNGGDINFGTGATISLNGANTLVGGDVYVGGGSTVTLDTNGGNVTVNGETLIANTNGLTINTNGGNIDFKSIVNSGNQYARLTGTNLTWDQADTLARNGTAGLGSVGDQYLATVTSRLENSVVVYTGQFVSGAALADGAWLGGRRVKGIGTDGVWRWVFGPEAAMDGGNGLAFFTGNAGSGGTPINGGFNNWQSGEPNGGNGSGGEDRLQIGDALGRWNDLNNNNIPLDIVIQETNLADSPLTINAGSGTATFRGAVGTKKSLASLDVTADGGIAINGGNVTTSGVQTYNDNVTLGAASTTLETTGASFDFTLGDNINIANATGSNASLTIKTPRIINMNPGSSITSAAGALDTTLWSDSDASGGGYIWLGSNGTTGATINSNGGNIKLSGGTDTATGYAAGVNGVMGTGIVLDTATLNSNGGNIVMRGKSSTAGTSVSTSEGSFDSTNGIRLLGGNSIDSGAGTISFTGVAQGTTGSSHGIETNSLGYSKITSASTNANAISFNGNASTGSSTNGWGTFLWGRSNAGILLAATGAGGGISLTGTGRDGTANSGGVHVEPNTFLLAASGPISITGTKGSTSTWQDVVLNGSIGYTATLPAGFAMASPVTASTSNITINADSFAVNRVIQTGVFANSAIQSSGVLTFAPRTNGTAIAVQTANPGSGLWIDPSQTFGASTLFKTGFSKVVFGNSTAGNVTLNDYTFNNDTELNTAGTATLGNVMIADNDLIVNVTGGGAVTDSGTVTADGLKLNASTSTATLDSANSVINKMAANIASLSLANNGAITIGTVEGMNGINATGAVNVSTASGDLTVAQNIATTSAANNAITLNAGKSADAGTATGGNIVLAGSPSFTTGAGGRTTLYTGSISGSTGLAALAGAGHYRYNSDETATNYTTALGSDIYAIYREAPVLTVAANDVSKIFDGQPFSGGSAKDITGFVNGDTSASISGSLSYGGSAQAARNVGTYQIAPSGLGNGLGYTFNYAPGILNILENEVQEDAITTAQAAAASHQIPQNLTPVHSTPLAIQNINPADSSGSVGGMEVVEISAADAENPDNFHSINQTGTDIDFLNVFVVDGGVRLPDGESEDDNDEQ